MLPDQPDDTSPPAADPRPLRLRKLLRATLRDSRGRESEVLVRNVSASGLGATTKDTPPARGERVSIDLAPLGLIVGEVRWTKGNGFGLALDHSIDVATLGAALKARAEGERPLDTRGDLWEIESRHRVVTPRTDPSRLRRV
jgi:hypothetical protein